MARKMRSGRAITPLPPGTKTLIETFPRMHFVYDSQMDPTVLSHVLELTNTPELRPALVMGYRLMFWGRYPALVQESGEVTSGFAFEIQNFEDASRLERYNPEEMDLQGVDANESETRCYDPSKYQARICMIKFEDGTSVLASALVWDGDEAILKKRSS